jgi:very-short-patch-repair endonuclease
MKVVRLPRPRDPLLPLPGEIRKKVKPRDWAGFNRETCPDKALFARYMREHPTATELLMAQMLGRLGYNYKFQVVMLGYIPDFYIRRHKLVLEVDGDVHKNRQAYDATRDQAFRSRGFHVLRIHARELLDNPDLLESSLQKRIEDAKGIARPSPPPRQPKKAKLKRVYQLITQLDTGKLNISFRPTDKLKGEEQWKAILALLGQETAKPIEAKPPKPKGRWQDVPKLGRNHLPKRKP